MEGEQVEGERLFGILSYFFLKHHRILILFPDDPLNFGFVQDPRILDVFGFLKIISIKI